jgi:hypothetical protein
VSDVSQPHLLDGWEVAGVIQQQQQQQQLSVREMLRHPGRSSGLYPVLSDPGEHADPQQQQQQRQLRGEPEQVSSEYLLVTSTACSGSVQVLGQMIHPGVGAWIPAACCCASRHCNMPIGAPAHNRVDRSTSWFCSWSATV